MYRRAFLAVQYSVRGFSGWDVVQTWGTVDVPWPPTRDDLQKAADDVVDAGKNRQRESVVVTSLTWISDVRET